MQSTPSYEEGPLLPIEGWLYTLIAPNVSMSEPVSKKTGKVQQPEHKDVLIKNKKGGG